LENTAADNLHDTTTKQLEEFKSLLVLKDNEISKLKTIINGKSNEAVNKMVRKFVYNYIVSLKR
jgi:succinate dehydrogenase flavin-adding protein (antitoxin of CptAB toxin-antitoxin module)